MSLAVAYYSAICDYRKATYNARIYAGTSVSIIARCTQIGCKMNSSEDGINGYLKHLIRNKPNF
jgi:hypothetical protein